MRLDGLCAEYGRGLPVVEVAAPSTANGGHRAAAGLLAGDPELDANCCSSDQLALGAIAELRSRGLRVPHDGAATIEDTGWEIFRLLLDVASGRRTWAERWELHNALALFSPAPVT